MPIGQSAFQEDMLLSGPGDIARPTGAGTIAHQGRLHGTEHGRMLSHAEIVVRAPNGDFMRRCIRPFAPESAREPAGLSFKIGEDAIATFRPQLAQPILKKLLKIHHSRPDSGRAAWRSC